MSTRSGIPMTKENRLTLLRGAREILSDIKHWGNGSLRWDVMGDDGEAYPTYCVLGAMEQAAYNSGLAVEQEEGNSFDESDWHGAGEPLGYLLGQDVSLNTYANEQYPSRDWGGDYKRNAYGVNDQLGYEATLAMLDGYIVEVEEDRPREPADSQAST